MTSSLAEVALWLALLVTSTAVILLRRRLKRFGGELVAYRQALTESTMALASAGSALRLLIGDGQALVLALAGKIEEADAALAPDTVNRRKTENADQ